MKDLKQLAKELSIRLDDISRELTELQQEAEQEKREEEMTIKHTPGPWKVMASQTGTTPFVLDSAHQEVAVCAIRDGDFENASLIAAAPELLEALECLISVLDLSWSDVDRSVIPEYRKATAIIARAKGE